MAKDSKTTKSADKTKRNEAPKGHVVLTADNAVELLTENEIAKRNRDVANLGTSNQEATETDAGDNFNK